MSADRSSERTPVAPRQPMRAAQESGDWASMLSEAGDVYDDAAVAPDAFDTMIAAFEGTADLDFDVDAGWGEPSESVVRASATTPVERTSRPLAAAREPEVDRAPSSARTKIGPFGPSTERALRSLDPREPSIEATRLDLFVAPAASAVEAAADATADEEPPRSYRTRVGLYFVPRDPVTEPSLPDEPSSPIAMPARTENAVRASRPARPRGAFSRFFARVRRFFGA